MRRARLIISILILCVVLDIVLGYFRYIYWRIDSSSIVFSLLLCYVWGAKGRRDFLALRSSVRRRSDHKQIFGLKLVLICFFGD